MPAIDLSILNQRQTPAFYADVFANRPAAGFVGRIFVSTNTFAFYRDNGTGWDLIGGPGTGTITGTGTANSFTIFTGASTIGDSSYLTQSANAINVASADIYLPANNTVGGTNYGLYQVMATNDYWKIYGNTQTAIDQGELVFEIGDNGTPGAADRFRFTIQDTSGGTDKDLLTLDFDESNFNTNLIVSSGNNLGVGVSVPSGLIHADGGASAARMIIDADNGIARIFSFRTDNLPRWALRVDGTETGSNVGGDFSIRRYDDTGAFVEAPLIITRSTGQSTFAKKVVIENNAGDQNLQIVSTTAPSIRLDNIQIGATKRAGLGISTATNNFIQGSADRDFCIFNGSTTASPILFGVYATTNVQEAARISSLGNLLVNTTVDNGKDFQVSGTGSVSSSFSMVSGQIGGPASYNEPNGTNGTLQFGNYTGGYLTGNIDNYIYKISGAIGSVAAQSLIFQTRSDVASGGFAFIAGTTPSPVFRINSSGEGTFTGRVTAGSMLLGEIISSYSVIESTGGNGIWLRPGGISSPGGLYAATNGNVLIGTTTDAGQKLQVNGNSYLNGYLLVGTSTSGGYKSEFYGGDNYTMLINQNSGVTSSIPLSINHFASSGAIRLIVFSSAATEVGSITTNGTTTSYNIMSDYRLKEDLKDFNGLSLINSIKTYDYKLKSNNERMFGVLAHELQTVLPYSVTGDVDGENYQGVDYSKIVPLLVKAIQELNTKIENLK
jgi:hypothetical protein